MRQSFILAIGSILGGVVGKLLFNYIITWIKVSDIVTVIQAAMIGVLMVLIYVFVKHRSKMRTYQLQSPYIISSMGFFLGMIAAFLGIGGGPFNVDILAGFFSKGGETLVTSSVLI